MHDAQRLTAELEKIQRAHRMPEGLTLVTTRTGKDGRTIYVVACANGYHESHESHEHALHLLVDSLRTRVEDTEAFHARIMAWGGEVADVKRARELARRLARKARKANPAHSGEQHDVTLAQAVDVFDAMHPDERAIALAEIMRGPP